MNINSDIDIDIGNRDILLSLVKHTPATMVNSKVPRKHNTGVYVTSIPTDDLNGRAGIDYLTAEKRSYFKLDLLNVHLYNNVRNEQHLNHLMREPDWSLLRNKQYCEQLIHIGNHYHNMCMMADAITSVDHMAMFLAVIRPGKKHLIGKSWADVAKTVWDNNNDGYIFKRSHSYAYAMLVVVNMNLLVETQSI